MSTSADLSFLEGYKAVRARLRNAKVQDALATALAPLVAPKAPAKAVDHNPPRYHESADSFDAEYGPPNIQSPLDRARFILTGMARFHEVTKNDITSNRRQAEIIPARFEAIYLVKESTPWSLPRIGRFFGGRDHTTIIHALRSYEAGLRGEKYIQPHRRAKLARIDAGEVIAP